MRVRARIDLAAVLVVTLCAAARAQPPEPIVVVTPDAAFRTALEDALAPAGMAVRPVADAPPPAIADIATASRALADREHASATVWLVFAGEAATLVAYDRGVDRVLVRSLAYDSPLTAEQAAEIARMARTMLRALRVTPDTDHLPPRAEEAPAIRASATAVPPPVASDFLAIDVDAGVRVRGPGADAVAAGSVAVTWRPSRLGLVLAGRFAPSAEVDSAGVMGRIGDQSLAVLVRLPLRPVARLTVAGSAGLAVHLITLDAELAGRPTDERRFDPAIRVGITTTYAIGPNLGVGLGVWADTLLRRQVYEVGPDEVLRVPLVQLYAGLLVTARIL